MADNITKIASEYDMVSIMQNIGSNYFGSDLSTQRVGMFGYLTESMAHMFGATVLDSSIRSNEYNTATAQRIETLLYEASMLNMEVTNAIPTTMSVYLGIKTSNIINPPHQGGYAYQETNINAKDHPTYTLVLEKDSVINIANYDFMYEYDIQIKAVWSATANKYMYSVRYLTEGDVDNTSLTGSYTYPKANTLTVLSNSYIPSYVTTKNGISMLLFKVNLKQMSKNTEYYTIIKNDMISLTGIDFLYDNMLSHFNIYYKPNGRGEWKYLKAVSVYDTSSYDEDVVRYEIIHDESKLKINITDFTPDYNSEFRVDMYNTLGETTNGLTYSGTGDDITVYLNSLDERHSYAGLDIGCLPIITLNDGRDVPDIEKIRKNVILLKSSLNSLDTEYDLYNFMKGKDDINDYVFIKKRSDAIERRYATFTIPRMETTDIIPSSTMNACIPLYSAGYEIEGIEYPKDLSETKKITTIKAGTPLTLIKDESSNDLNYYKDCKEEINNAYSEDEFYKNNTIVVLDRSEVYTEGDQQGEKKYPTSDSIISLESSRKVFGTPYTIAYDETNQIASFYLNSISRNVSVNMTEDETETVVNFAIDHFTIERNAAKGDSSYTITVSVMPNGDYTKSFIGENYNVNEVANTIMLKGYIYKSDDPQVLDGYFDFKYSGYSDGIFVFKSEIIIDDSLNSTSNMSNMLNLYNMRDLQIDSYDANDFIELQNGSIVEKINFGKAKHNNAYLNMEVFNSRIGIGIYYLDRDESTEDGYDFSQNITDVGNNDYGDLVMVVDMSSPQKVAYTSNVSSLMSYPDFVMKCLYSKDSDEKIIPVKYTLTNVYDNASDLMNLYTVMSDFVKSTSTITKDGKYLILEDVPVLQYSKSMDSQASNRITNIISETKEYLEEINDRITNNFSIDYKFFRTYGPCKYFNLSTVDGNDKKLSVTECCTDPDCICNTDGKSEAIMPGVISLGNLDITIEFNILIRNGLSVSDNEVVTQLKSYIKSYIEKLNNQDNDYTIYISNVITELETKFIDFIKSIELVSINGNNDMYRVLRYDLPEEFKDTSYRTGNSKNNIREYIPEYINVPLNNITINITRSKY